MICYMHDPNLASERLVCRDCRIEGAVGLGGKGGHRPPARRTRVVEQPPRVLATLPHTIGSSRSFVRLKRLRSWLAQDESRRPRAAH